MVGPGLHVHARQGVHHPGTEDCLARGFDRTGFFEVDTGEQRAWTVQLTDTAEQAAAGSARRPGRPGHAGAANAGRARPVCSRPESQNDETSAPHQDRRDARPRLSGPRDDRALFEAGADVFRINMSHTSHDRCASWSARSARRKGATAGRSASWSICRGRSCGRRLRRRLRHAQDNGATFTLDSDKAPGDATRVHLPHPEIFAGRSARPHAAARRRQGAAHREDVAEKIVTRVEVGGKLSDRKGVSLPDTICRFSALTPKDRSDLEAALDAGVDWIALSFIQRPRTSPRPRRSRAAAPP
jgi:hypothetical protein